MNRFVFLAAACLIIAGLIGTLSGEVTILFYIFGGLAGLFAVLYAVRWASDGGSIK